jgi:hypothetical protein
MGQAGGEAFRVRSMVRREFGRPRANALLRQAVVHVGSALREFAKGEKFSGVWDRSFEGGGRPVR